MVAQPAVSHRYLSSEVNEQRLKGRVSGTAGQPTDGRGKRTVSLSSGESGEKWSKRMVAQPAVSHLHLSREVNEQRLKRRSGESVEWQVNPLMSGANERRVCQAASRPRSGPKEWWHNLR